jgi:hypothetical protein
MVMGGGVLSKMQKFELKAWDNHKAKLKMKEQCADDEKIPYQGNEDIEI